MAHDWPDPALWGLALGSGGAPAPRQAACQSPLTHPETAGSISEIAGLAISRRVQAILAILPLGDDGGRDKVNGESVSPMIRIEAPRARLGWPT